MHVTFIPIPNYAFMSSLFYAKLAMRKQFYCSHIVKFVTAEKNIRNARNSEFWSPKYEKIGFHISVFDQTGVPV